MSYIRNLFRGGMLLSTALVPFAAMSQSPFSGEFAEPTASRELDFGAPTYEAPATSLQSDAMAASPLEAVRGATSFNRSLASNLELSLPEGVTLLTSEADASFVTIGQSAAAVDREPIFPQEMDNEQAAELTEDIDREQAAELGGSGMPATVNKIIVHYPVAMKNIPVSKYADVTAFVNSDGRIDTLRKRNLPTSLDSETAEITSDEALAVAVADSGPWAETADIDGPQLEVWVDENGAGRLSYRIELTDNGEEPKARRYWVSATEGAEIIFWESMMHHQHFGNATGTAWTDAGTPTGPTTSDPVQSMNVNRSGGGVEVTNEIGNYAFGSGAGLRTMSGNLSGPNSVIDNFGGAEISRSSNGTPAAAADLNFNASGEAELAQTTAFIWTNKAHALAADILDPTDLPNLPTIVNRPGQCNAFWNGTSINFYVAGGGCPNMAYDSVVLHEYGHGIDARKGGIVNGGYSEGFGDATSILGTRKSCVGSDFFGPGTCLREAKDLIMWPPAGGVHQQGRIYAGFTWELTQQLKTLYADDTAFEVARQLVMGAAKANPSDIEDAVRLSFIVDDDDGDLKNGTPHFVQLAAAANSRNIPRPADPTKNVRRMGFAWANNPTAANYTPSTFYSYNASGGPISISRIGTGTYNVNFVGLGGQGVPGGNVQVTGYGSSRNDCKVQFWSSASADFSARVRCFTPNGALVDDRYTVLITWP